MSNIKISELPTFTGSVAGTWLVMDTPDFSTTYKVLRENMIGGTSGTSGTSGYNGANGTSGTSGSSGSSGTSGTSGSSGSSGSNGSDGSSGTSGTNGSSGTSGSSGISGGTGSSGTSGDSIFALTGSVWNTTNNVGITGSFYLNGSTRMTGSLNVIGSQLITGSLKLSGSLATTGSISGNYIPLTVVSSTASLNLNDGTFFRLALVNGDIRVEPSNIKAGQTINILMDSTSANSSTVSFPTTVKQVSGSAYTPTALGTDVVSLISFSGTNLYLANIKNFI